MNESELKKTWEANLKNNFDLSVFLSVKYLSIHLCTQNGNLYENQIWKLKVCYQFWKLITFLEIDYRFIGRANDSSKK